MAEAQLNDFPSLFSLKGKVAVVTGGSRGLGLHAASAFLQAGASKVFISSRKASACEEACKALNALPNLQPGAVAISVPADSAKFEGVESLLAQVKKHTDRVDILFANAGATWGESFDTHPDSAFAKVMDLNVKAVFNTIRLFTPLLEKSATIQDPSRVLITASVAGLAVGTIGRGSRALTVTLPARLLCCILDATWPWSWDPDTSPSTLSALVSSPARCPTDFWRCRVVLTSSLPPTPCADLVSLRTLLVSLFIWLVELDLTSTVRLLLLMVVPCGNAGSS
ncbi:hypothetical protein NXS19_002311 [Fusarium pseudograminearum]|nr:hypothetical protein NXS19_002311 [Fusarium pseudograminearum]